METHYEVLVKKWTEFFRERGYSAEITAICDSYPDRQSLTVPYPEINAFGEDLSLLLLEHPTKTIRAAEQAIMEFVPQDVKERTRSLGLQLEINFRIKELPPLLAMVEVRKIRSTHLNRMIAVKGLVRNVVQVRPRLHLGAFRCLRCQGITYMVQERMTYREPVECSNCGKNRSNTVFRLSVEDSFFIDSQKIEVQESPEGLRGGEQPQRLVAYLEKDLAGMLYPGNKVILNGILRATPPKTSRSPPTTFNIYLDVVGIELEEHDFEDIEITADEEEEIKELSRDPAIYDRIATSIAPTIYGLEEEKHVLALQLFGGVTKMAPDNTRIRGDIHVLLVGDPGTAKSQLLTYISRLSPRGIYASGQAATKAGLTAAAVRDEFGEGRWTLEAGALVLADRGIACIDEIDKMRSEDRSSMHEAMAQQTVSVAKAGITATLQARCSILAAANPQHGRFDRYRTIIEQINLPTPLITRFDVIFSLTDAPNVEKDSELAEHILRTSQMAEMKARSRALGMPIATDGYAEAVPSIPVELLRKYIAYARKTIFPVLNEEAMRRIRDYYVDMRRLYSTAGTVAITARQLESLVRLAEASARVRLSEEVTVEDAERAIGIIERFLRKVAVSEEGQIDIDIITTGMPRTRLQRKQLLYNIIRSRGSEGITHDELLKEAESEGIDFGEAEYLINHMMQEGTIWEPRSGLYRATRE